MPFGNQTVYAKRGKNVPRREKYKIWWDHTYSDLQIEIAMVRAGGTFKRGNHFYGEGLAYHFRQVKSLLWPSLIWHKWNLLEMECFLKYRIIGEMGPASSGKTNSAATNFLADYFCFPECTTVLVSSTTRESLEMRVWGEMKAYYRKARDLHAWIPGFLIEGRQRVVTDGRSEAKDGRDFRNGIVGIACKKGANYQGLGEYVGIKNKRVRLLADELSFMPKDFIHAVANLNKNPDFKCCGLGNPKDTQDALGYLCEPATALGGWDGGIDQRPGTKTWQIRFEQGICVQLPGSDSPNLDGRLGCPLISQKDIDSDIAFWGKDSLQYTMMNEGRMPRGAGSRRVLTRALCGKYRAMEQVVWRDSNQIRIGALDAAYRGVGGDRCIFGELRFGVDNEGLNILNLEQVVLVPIFDDVKIDPEYQVADFVKSQLMQRGIPANQFYFDSTGRGSLMSAFAKTGLGEVNAIEFGGQASDRPVPGLKPDPNGGSVLCRNYFFNFVTELWFLVRIIVEAGQWRGMTEDALQEGCAREWGFAGAKNPRIQVEPKPQMKLKTGRSPDVFDMVAVGTEGARRLGFKISNLAPDSAKRKQNWFKDVMDRSRKLWHSQDLSSN